MKRYFSIADMVVILITFILFTIALFVKGLTHDLLLESGVLLISVKLIMMNYKLYVSNDKITEKLTAIEKILKDLHSSQDKKQ
jgi:hypothetical protein